MTAPFVMVRQLLGLRWFRFAIVGAAATVSYYLLGLFFVPFLDLPLLLGNALAYVLSFAVSYIGQSQWTFATRQPHTVMLPRFAITQGIGLMVNSCVIEALTRMGINYELAMVAAIVSVPVIVYILCKCWVFRQEKRERVEDGQ